MKSPVLFSFILLLFSCSGINADTEITLENAGNVTSFENTPESVVMYFYASRIRQDSKWQEVCLPQALRSGKLQHGLEKYNSWTFTKYRFVSKKQVSENEWWITIYIEISVDGEVDKGEDTVTVTRINGTFFIMEVPT